MRWFLYILLCLFFLVFSGCKKDGIDLLSKEQKGTLKVFNGTFKSFYGLDNKYYETIKFLSQYNPPKKYEIKDILGNKYTVSIHGDFEYFNSMDCNVVKYCYFVLSNGMDMLSYEYSDSGSLTVSRKLFDRVVVDNENTLRIFEDGEFLPSIYKRQ